MKKILVTGCTGSLGSAIIKEFYGKYDIIGLARSENKIWQMENEYPNIEYICCDIRNLTIEKEIDYLIHCAALKHIKYCAKNPNEAIGINIDGTKRLIKYAKKYCKEKFVFIGTDKSVEPCNIYGATKLIGEDLILDANKVKPIFNVLRLVNLFGSSGSVVPIILKEPKDKPHKVTDIRSTRYFITFKQAVEQIKEAMKAPAGTIIAKKSKVIRIMDLIRTIKGDDAKIEIIGLQPGEKLMEKLSIDDEPVYEYYTKDEIREMLNELQEEK